MLNDLDRLSMPLLASFIGRKYGIKVIIDTNADTAMTDGEVIILPLLDDSPESKIMITRYIDHEAAHVRFSPFDELKKWEDEGLSVLEHTIANMFEDVRVERLLIRQMPGCYDNLVQGAKLYFRKQDEIADAMRMLNFTIPPTSPSDEFLEYLSEALLSRHMPESKNGGFHKKEAYAKKYPSLTKEIEHVLERVMKAVVFQDVKECTKAIMAILKNQGRQGQPQNQSGEQDNFQDNSRPSGSSENGQSDDRLNSSSSSEDVHASGCEAIKDAILDSQDDSSFEKKAREVLDAICEEHQVATSKFGSAPYPFYELQNPDLWLEFNKGKKLNASAFTADTLRLKNKLKQLLQADSFEKKRPSFSGKLAPRKLYQARVGNTRLFRSTEHVKKEDTVLHILLDNSSSMKKDARMELASNAMAAIVQSLKSEARFNLGVTAFNSKVWPLLRHGERVHDKLYVHHEGGTELALGLCWAMQEMMFLREPRKVIIVVTDGDLFDHDLLKNTLHQLDILGIEVVALVIQVGTHSLDKISTHNTSIKSIGDLPQAMFSLLKGLSL